MKKEEVIMGLYAMRLQGKNRVAKERNNTVDRAVSLINQLDEPETLSQEWIDDHKVARINNLRKMTTSDVVEVEKLKNLLVPKQELPAIPKFVADWIEGNKEFEEKWNDYSKEDAMNDTIHFTIYGLFADYPATNSDVELRKPVIKWLSVDRGNYFKLVNSVRYGYEVEEEQKYYVLNKTRNSAILVRMFDEPTLDPAPITEIDEVDQFTEQEIKDYDDRFWPFAVKVEELERE